jgi:hypothetical protein
MPNIYKYEHNKLVIKTITAYSDTQNIKITVFLDVNIIRFGVQVLTDF